MTTGAAIMARRQQATGNLFAAGSMFVWAAGFPAVEVLMQDFDLPTVMAGRFLFALIVLIPVWLAVEGWERVRAARWGRGLWIGAVGFGMGAGGTLLAQAFTDPVTVAIFSAATPLCASVVDWIWQRRGFTVAFLIGLVAAVVGGIVSTGGVMPASFGLGALSAIVAGLFFSWGSLMVVRDMPDHSVLARTTVTAAGVMVAMLVILAGMALAGRASLPADALSWRNAGLFLVYGTLAFALSQFLWVAATDRLGVTLASFHINVSPFYTMLILLALGGAWSWPQAIGAAIVGLGVVLAQR